MTLESWIVLWKTVLLGGIGLFAALAIVVTIGGARDIAKLLRTLRAQQTDEKNGANDDAP